MALVRFEALKVAEVELFCRQVGSDVWVQFEPLCRALSLDSIRWMADLSDPDYNPGQVRYVATAPGDGRPVPHIHFRSIPVWLNKLDLRKILDLRQRDRVKRLQAEAAQAIEAHFFGPSETGAPNGLIQMPSTTEEALLLACQQLVDQRRAINAATQVAHDARGLAESAASKADAAVRHSLFGRGNHYTVRACCILWGLPGDKDYVCAQGKLVKRAAKLQGCAHLKKETGDEDFGEVNSWPADFIFRYFTHAHGPCPKEWVRDFLR